MKEYRSLTGNIETRQEESEEPVISGYAAVFNRETDMGWFVESIDPGAFAQADMAETIAAFNHDENELLSRVTGADGDLVLSIDQTGLKYEFKGKNEKSREVAQNIKLGFVRGSSFAFTISSDKWEYDIPMADGTKKDKRTILGIEKLYDVSPVVFPAYGETSAMSRSIKELRNKVEHEKPKQQDLIDLKIANKQTKNK